MDANGIITDANSIGAGLLDRLPNAPIPTPHEYLAQMQFLNPFVAILVLGAGLVILLQGWRIFRVWVIVTAGMVGVVAGDWIGSHVLQDPYYRLGAPIVGGLLLAALAWPLMKHALGLIGGLTGGFLGYSLVRYLSAAMNRPDWAQYGWLGAIGGAVVLGALAYFLFRLVVIISSSLQGAVMVVSGIVALLLKYPPVCDRLKETLEGSPHILMAVMAVPAVIGILFQFFWTAPHRPAPAPEE